MTQTDRPGPEADRPSDVSADPADPFAHDEPMPPERAGAGRERTRMVRALVFVALLGLLACVPMFSWFLRLR